MTDNRKSRGQNPNVRRSEQVKRGRETEREIWKYTGGNAKAGTKKRINNIWIPKRRDQKRKRERVEGI